MKELTKEQRDFCFDVYNQTNVDMIYYVSNDYSFDDFIEEVQSNNLTDEEVIYYSNAIDYLKENDNSLNKSIEIALEYGYELININSELLATLLKSRNNAERFEEMINDIKEFFESL